MSHPMRRDVRRATTRAILAPLLAATTTLAAACGSDASGPDDTFSGRYVLESANGAALPFVVHRDLFGRPITVLTAGSITAQSRGRLLDVRTFTLGQDASNLAPQSDSLSYAFTRNGGALYVSRPRINPDQSHVDSGTVTSESITLFVRYVVAGEASPTSATLTYRRAP